MELHDLIVPAGIFTFVVMWMSVLSGTRKIKVDFRWHRRFGLIGIVAASTHAAIVLYYEFFL
jgi:hypothetical protein